MWGHYTKSHCGLVLGIDTANDGFFPGTKREGFPVSYAKERLKLPVAYYRGIGVEIYDLMGNIKYNSNEPVKSSGGIVSPFSEYRRQVEAASLGHLTTKALDWEYEEEVRFIYELKKHNSSMKRDGGREFVKPIPSFLQPSKK